jgi:hypothetical protein
MLPQHAAMCFGAPQCGADCRSVIGPRSLGTGHQPVDGISCSVGGAPDWRSVSVAREGQP